MIILYLSCFFQTKIKYSISQFAQSELITDITKQL